MWDILWVLLSADHVKEIPQMWKCHLGPYVFYVSPKVGGWTKTFFVVFLMLGSGLGAYSNCLAVPREETLHVFGSFSFGALIEHLVVVFLSSIVPIT
jgi:hypothetical protein